MRRSVNVPDHQYMEVAVYKSGNGLRCDCLLEVVFSEDILQSNQFSAGEQPTTCAYTDKSCVR